MAVQLAGRNHDIQDVTKGGFAKVQAVIQTDMEHRNESGNAYCLPFDAVDPTAGDDIFLYMKNTESSLDMHIRRIRLSSTVIGMLEVLRVTGTPVGGAAVTLVNFNDAFSTKTPSGTFETAVDITGLTDGGKYAFQQLAVADTTYEITFHHDIILAKNSAMALNWVPTTGILSGVVYFFLNEDD